MNGELNRMNEHFPEIHVENISKYFTVPAHEYELTFC